MTTCPHNNFQVVATVNRLSDKEGGPVTGYAADIQIACADCRTPFKFLGVASGMHHSAARVNVDGTQLRAPIQPVPRQ